MSKTQLSKVIPALLVLFVLASGFQQQPLKKVKVTEFLSMQVPEHFSPMSQQDMNQKYQTYRLPVAMYTDPNRVVDLGINRSFTTWQADDIQLVHSFYKATVLNIYTDVQMITDEVRNINGRDYVVLEFVGTVKDEQGASFRSNKQVSKYQYLLYTIYENNSLVINFNAPARYQPQWQETARAMMQSVVIK